MLLSPAASLDAMHQHQQRRTNQTKTKTNYSAKNALNAAFNCAGNFFGPSHPLGKYSERRNNSIGKIFGKKIHWENIWREKIHWENIGNLSPEEPGSKIKLHSSVQFDLESGLNFATLKCNQSVSSITILLCFSGRISNKDI